MDTPSSVSIIESVDIQQQVQSSLSLAESSTITESSSDESANSLRPTLSIPSSESTVIGPIIETTINEKETLMNTENENIESDNEHRSETIHSLPSEKRDVIDSWMNNKENSTAEYVSIHYFEYRLTR
jgi:hypothetical protein